jgi:hypothetical protein
MAFEIGETVTVRRYEAPATAVQSGSGGRVSALPNLL